MFWVLPQHRKLQVLPQPCELHHGQGFPNHPQPFPGAWIFLNPWLFSPGATCSSWSWNLTALAWLDPGSHHSGDNPSLSPFPPSLSPVSLCPSSRPLSPPWMLFSLRARFVLATACARHRQAVTAQSRSPAAKLKRKKQPPSGGGSLEAPLPPFSCPPTKATTPACCLLQPPRPGASPCAIPPSGNKTWSKGSVCLTVSVSGQPVSAGMNWEGICCPAWGGWRAGRDQAAAGVRLGTSLCWCMIPPRSLHVIPQSWSVATAEQWLCLQTG